MVILLTIITNKIQEVRMHLHQINLKTCNLEFLYSEVWLTDQNSKPLEIEERINITLVIN